MDMGEKRSSSSESAVVGEEVVGGEAGTMMMRGVGGPFPLRRGDISNVFLVDIGL